MSQNTKSVTLCLCRITQLSLMGQENQKCRDGICTIFIDHLSCGQLSTAVGLDKVENLYDCPTIAVSPLVSSCAASHPQPFSLTVNAWLKFWLLPTLENARLLFSRLVSRGPSLYDSAACSLWLQSPCVWWCLPPHTPLAPPFQRTFITHRTHLVPR